MLTTKERWAYKQARRCGYAVAEAWQIVKNLRKGFHHPCLGQRYTSWVGKI